MKNLILLLSLFLLSCNTKQPKVVPFVEKEPIALHKCPESIVIIDTVFVPKTTTDTKSYDSLVSVIKKKNDSLFVERYRLERVKYYNGIAQRNSSQLKFLVGWINRAVK